jgi:hypothetical protein
MQGIGGLASCTLQVFQNFSNVPVLHYLQAVAGGNFVHLLKFEHFHEYFIQYSSKSRGTLYHTHDHRSQI